MADLITRLGLVSGDQDAPRTAAQVARMPIRQLLQDPVRAAIYNRGWADRTADIQRRLQPPTTVANTRLQPQPTTTSSSHISHQRRPQQRPPPPTATATVRRPETVTPREPSPVPGPSGVHSTPAVRVRTEAQQARNKRKFLKLKEKKLARERLVSQQYRLTKQPTPVSEPEAASTPPPQPTPPVAMEVDPPATEGQSPEESGPSTSQAGISQAVATETSSEDTWLSTPGPSLEEVPDVAFDDNTFATPIGSPTQH